MGGAFILQRECGRSGACVRNDKWRTGARHTGGSMWNEGILDEAIEASWEAANLCL